MMCPPLAPRVLRLAAMLALALGMIGCDRQGTAEPQAPARPATTARAGAAAPAARLQDVVESTPQYIVGISYPGMASRYPGLAVELRRYAEQARRELLDAAQGRIANPGDAPYELTLGFTGLVDSPSLVAVAADGSRYTGGAHSEPLIARFVWLPNEQRLLTAADLVPDRENWKPIAAMVRDQLRSAARQRLEADGVAAGEQNEYLADAGRMIDEGTQPDADHFSTFEPIMAPDGRVGGLRFVFPPYQVGPYADGTQTVDVPAAMLLPYVAARYRPLFTGAAG